MGLYNNGIEDFGTSKEHKSRDHLTRQSKTVPIESTSRINGSEVDTTDSDTGGGSEEELAEPIRVPERRGSFIKAVKRSRPTKSGFGFSKVSRPLHYNPDDYDQKYPDDEPGYELGMSARIWRTYVDEAMAFDMDLVETWKGDVDVLLTFTGLFCGVVTTFVVQTSQKLEEDQSKAIVSLLTELVGTQSGTVANTTLPSGARTPISSATSFDRWVNGLWFTSLSFGLATALGAVLAKQWLQHYTSVISGVTQQRVRIRQFRFTGLQKWGFPFITAILPILLHIAVFLFFVGLVVFLFPLDRDIAYVVASVGGMVYLAYLLSVILGAISLQCPYKTPLTSALHHLFTLTIGAIRTTRAVFRPIFALLTQFKLFHWIQGLFTVLVWPRKHQSLPKDSQISVRKCGNSFPADLFSKGLRRWQRGYLQSWPLKAEIQFAEDFGEDLDAQAMRWLLISSPNPTAQTIVAKALPAQRSGAWKGLDNNLEDPSLVQLLRNSQTRARLLVAGAVKSMDANQLSTPDFKWKRDVKAAEHLFQACHLLDTNWRDTVAPIFSNILNPRRSNQSGKFWDLRHKEGDRIDTIVSAVRDSEAIRSHLIECLDTGTTLSPVVWTGLFEALSAVYFAFSQRKSNHRLHFSSTRTRGSEFSRRWALLEHFLTRLPLLEGSSSQLESIKTQTITNSMYHQLSPVTLTDSLNQGPNDICYALISSALLIFSAPVDSRNDTGLEQQLIKCTENLTNMAKSDFYTRYCLVSIVLWLHCLCRLPELSNDVDSARVSELAARHLFHWSIYLNERTFPSDFGITQQLIQPIVGNFVLSDFFLSYEWPSGTGGSILALYFYIFPENSNQRNHLVDELCQRPRRNLIPALIYSVGAIPVPEDHFTVDWINRTIQYPKLEGQHRLKPVSKILLTWSRLQEFLKGSLSAGPDASNLLFTMVQHDFLSAVATHSSLTEVNLKGRRLEGRAWARWVEDGHDAIFMKPSMELMSTALHIFTMVVKEDRIKMNPEQKKVIYDYFYTTERITRIWNILISMSRVTKWWLPNTASKVVRFEYDWPDLELLKTFQSVCPHAMLHVWENCVESLSEHLRQYHRHVLLGHNLVPGSKKVRDYQELKGFVSDVAIIINYTIYPPLPSYRPLPVASIGERLRSLLSPTPRISIEYADAESAEPNWEP